MKKKLLWITGILTGLIIIITAFLITQISSLKKSLFPVQTGRITDHVFAVNSGVASLYVYTDGKEAVCIDAGTDAKLVSKEFEKTGLNPQSVKAVFLTHTDYDHTGGLGAFPNAQVYISQDEEQMVNGKTARFFGLMHNKLGRKTILLKDGEKISAGPITVEALATPGHTPGSMSYLIGTSLFTGDTLRLENGAATNFMEFINMDTPLEIKSMIKLAKLKNIGIMLTGHSGYTTNFIDAMKNYR